jgi:hypothetical protein
MTWEYLVVLVQYKDDWKVQGQKGRSVDWGIRLPSDHVILGWNKIMWNYSSQGWELVSAVADESPMGSVRAYRLFLKRPLQELSG